MFWKELCQKLQIGSVDEKKTKLDIEKHGDGMMMLVIVLVRSRSYGKEWNQGTARKEKYLEGKKEPRRNVYHANHAKYKAETKDLEMLCSRMIRNVICLRLQRRWSKLISLLLVSSA